LAAKLSTLPVQISYVFGIGESRQLKLSANIRFGNNQVKASRQRKSAIEDENKRTENSEGIGGTN
jgi:iron complex outermembrane recepter protein